MTQSALCEELPVFRGDYHSEILMSFEAVKHNVVQTVNSKELYSNCNTFTFNMFLFLPGLVQAPVILKPAEIH